MLAPPSGDDLQAVTFKGVRSCASVAAGFLSLLFLSREISLLALVTVPAATAFFVTVVRAPAVTLVLSAPDVFSA